MILIANPLYDVVFKYLLDDLEIAKELLSVILGVEIIDLAIRPQETLVKDEISGEIRIFHLDFKAVIKISNGTRKTVLIELQKAKKSHDISRFRVYLGENYKKQETIVREDGSLDSVSLEIVSIYILGFNLRGVDVPVLKVSRNYTDAITNEPVTATNDFIAKLTHESYTIQVPRLKHDQRNRLEEVLEIFSQDRVTDNLHKIEISKESRNPLVKKMINRLSKAASDEEIRRQMEAEDMIVRLIDRETQERIAEYMEKLDEKENEIKQKEEENEELKRQIDALKKMLGKG